MSYRDTTSYAFRGWGVLLAMLFHLAMVAWAFSSENALEGGYRWLFTWYMPSIVLGLPWSIPAMFMDAFVPGLGILGLAIAVCLNGYLCGWLIDALVSSGPSRVVPLRTKTLRAQPNCADNPGLTPALTMQQLLASESAMKSGDHD